MNRARFSSGASGLSLIEVMIALAIGTVLILGLSRVFEAARTAYQLSEGMARSQENARFAIEVLQRDIRMAGHYGCVNDQAHLQSIGALVNHFPASTPATSGIGFPVSVRGYEANATGPGATVNLSAPVNGWMPALPAALAALGPVPGSDLIELRFLAGEGVPVSAITNPTATTTTISFDASGWSALTANGVASPMMFGIADCSFADVFPATAAAAGSVSVASGITRYTPQPSGQTMLYRAESIVYYIAPGASGVASLWRARSTNGGIYPAGGREELVEGIESMQFIYGLDRVSTLDTTPPSGYIEFNQSAAGITNTAEQWRRVGIVQIGLLASSPNPAASVQSTVNKRTLGVQFAVPAGDTHFRATYESTVALRNRLYGN